MLSFDINTESVEESNLFLRKLWCELNKIGKNSWLLQPFNQKQRITIGRNNVGKIAFDYKKKGCIKKLYIDPVHEEDTEKIRVAVQNALSGKFKIYSVRIKLIPEYKHFFIAPVSKQNISFSLESDCNFLTLNLLAYASLDIEKSLEFKLWTLQALLYEYTLQYFTINAIEVCASEFYCEDTKPIDYDYSWLDRSDYPSDKNKNIIVPEECLVLISNLFADQIKGSDELLYNSARVLLTAHQLETGMDHLRIPGIIDITNSTAISSIEPLAYFMNRQEGQCDKCGNKIFSVVAKIRELLTKYFNESFARYYCKTYYSDRSKLFHQGCMQSNYIKCDTSCPLLDPQNPTKILMPSGPVDPTLFDCASYVFRNIIHEYYDGTLIIKDKDGQEIKLDKMENLDR